MNNKYIVIDIIDDTTENEQFNTFKELQCFSDLYYQRLKDDCININEPFNYEIDTLSGIENVLECANFQLVVNR